jgi:chromosomal replication initiation ATPase DnaA
MHELQVNALQVRKRLWQPDHIVREERDFRRISEELERVRSELRATQQNLATAHLTIQEQAEQLLSADVKRELKQRSLQGIISAVSEHLRISITEILSEGRTRPVVYARWLCFYVARKETKLSLTTIGRRMKMDHTTVLHGIRGFEAKLPDPKVLADFNAVKARLA